MMRPWSTVLCPGGLESCWCHRTGLFSCSHTFMQLQCSQLPNTEGTETSSQIFCPRGTKDINQKFSSPALTASACGTCLVGKPSPSCKATHCSSYQEGKDYIPLNDSHSSEDDGFSQVPSSAQQNSDEEDFDMRIRCHSLAAR